MNIILPAPKTPKDREDSIWSFIDFAVTGIKWLLDHQNNKNLSTQVEFWRNEAEAQRLRAERAEIKIKEETKEIKEESECHYTDS